MLQVCLQTPGAGPLQLIESLKELRFEQNILRAHDRVVARYEQGLWKDGDSNYFVVRVDSPCRIVFEDGGERSEVFGPFPAARIVAGVILAGVSAEHALAGMVAESGHWRLYDDRKLWTLALVIPAEESVQ